MLESPRLKGFMGFMIAEIDYEVMQSILPLIRDNVMEPTEYTDEIDMPGFNVENNHITFLSLSSCGIRRIPESIQYLSHLKHYCHLGNKTTKIPDWIGNLKNLEKLNVSFNNIYYVDKSIGDLSNLEQLSIQNNKIKNLPDSLTKLEKLKFLYLNGNPLSKLPENIDAMKSLTNIAFSGTNIEKLPSNIVNNKILNEVWLDKNPNLVINEDQKRWLDELEKNGCNVFR